MLHPGTFIKYLQKQELLEILWMKLELGIDRSAVGKEEEGTQRDTQKYKEHVFQHIQQYR